MSAWSEELGERLRGRSCEGTLALDLFAGCGGLSLGFEASGFRTLGYEMQREAAATYNANLHGRCQMECLSVGQNYPSASVVIGGPPCQPFSVFGKQAGAQDERDGFPIYIDAVARLRPRVFLFENVRNLAKSHRSYLERVLSELRHLGYIVESRVLNAVDYGVPQQRQRLIVVGHRGGFRFPRPTVRRTTVGEAIGDLIASVQDERKILTARQDAYIAVYEAKSSCVNPRDLYEDRPARTLTCRNLAGCTSDMQRVRLSDGRRRRLTVREAARLQSFPDWFEFQGVEARQFYQIGNAVPPLLSMALGEAVRESLERPELSAGEIERANERMKEPSLFATL